MVLTKQPFPRYNFYSDNFYYVANHFKISHLANNYNYYY